MTTYAALFGKSPAHIPDSAYDEAGIADALIAAGAKSVETQLGEPGGKSGFVLAEFEVDLAFEDVEYAMKNAFELGLGPIRLIEGNIAQLRDLCHSQMITGVWTHSAWLNHRREEQDVAALLELVNRHADSEYPTFAALRDAKAPFWPLWRALRDAEARIKALQVLPEQPVLEEERERVAAEANGLLDRWVSLHERMIDIDRRLANYGGIYNTNPRCAGRVGNMNLAVQAMVHAYMDKYAPTNDHGDLEDGADERVHDLGWRLVNILDGEWGGSQRAQVDADEGLEALGFDARWLVKNLERPAADRLGAYRTVEAELKDNIAHALTQVRNVLGLSTDDVN